MLPEVDLFQFGESDETAGYIQRFPVLRSIIEKAGINVAAVGDESFCRSCEQYGIDAQVLLSTCALAVRPCFHEDTEDWTSATLEELMAHILAVHHSFIRVQLGRLQALVRGLVATEPVRDAAGHHLDHLQSAIAFLQQRWLGHLQMEEQDFFPSCMRLEQERQFADRVALDEMMQAIRHVSHDHADINRLAERAEQALDAVRGHIQESNETIEAIGHTLEQFRLDAEVHAVKEDEILLPAILFAHEVRRSDTESGRFEAQG